MPGLDLDVKIIHVKAWPFNLLKNNCSLARVFLAKTTYLTVVDFA
jgi:hypothetical protein